MGRTAIVPGQDRIRRRAESLHPTRASIGDPAHEAERFFARSSKQLDGITADVHRLEGKVDGSRRGLIGHSWGGLAAHLAASRDTTIDSLVLFDPNDDGTEGLVATPTITASTLQLLAAVPGLCNSAWREDMVTAMLPMRPERMARSTRG